MPDLPAWAGWIGIAAAIIAGIGLALGLAILIAPITALIAGIFSTTWPRWSSTRIIRTIRPAGRCRP
ncbi:MAG: hypothetical protein H6891_11225 [Brucellaceae bacterium]|nr:hypothetical protein [Brucellaceae bacterium]